MKFGLLHWPQEFQYRTTNNYESTISDFHEQVHRKPLAEHLRAGAGPGWGPEGLVTP